MEIPDQIKQYAIDLQNTVSLIYTGYPLDGSNHTLVSTRQLQRLKHLENSLRNYMTEQLGLFWETEYLRSKNRKRDGMKDDQR